MIRCIVYDDKMVLVGYSCCDSLPVNSIVVRDMISVAETLTGLDLKTRRLRMIDSSTMCREARCRVWATSKVN